MQPSRVRHNNSVEVDGRRVRPRTSRYTTEQFVAAARGVHGDRYDYSNVDYLGGKLPVTIVCTVHGPFQQTPNGHLTGRGCRKCATAAAGDRYRKSSAAFIAEARAIHGQRYDYSAARYSGANRGIQIFCALHGVFTQSPSAHLRGQGCPGCGKDRIGDSLRWTTAEFLAVARGRFGERYQYDGVNYIDSWTPVRITCREHGTFEQLPVVHVRSTYGCPKCATEATHANARMSLQHFLERAAAVHGAHYAYEQVKLTDSKAKITIRCHKHGTFSQSPADHLAGKGCAKCRNEANAERQRQPVHEFIERARSVHGDKYDYSMVEYSSARRKVRIGCPVHGAFEQTPDTHLQAGCRRCADDALPGAYSKRRFSADDDLASVGGTLYYARFDAEDGEAFYKIGISRNHANKRFAGYGGGYGYRMTVLASVNLPLAEAYRIEQFVLQKFGCMHPHLPRRRSKTGRRFGGRTECFAVPLPPDLECLIADATAR